MSKRSQHKLNQRVREGTEGRRRVQLHVMRTQTQRIADRVAAQLQVLIAEEVTNELDRRGYRDREDGMPFIGVSQEFGAKADTETPEPVEKEASKNKCPHCELTLTPYPKDDEGGFVWFCDTHGLIE